MKTLFIRLIYLYRIILSPMLGHNCRFNPTCSVYTQEAIRQYGIVKGILLGVWRILRCNPWNAGGDDPVPSKKFLKIKE